MEGALTILMFIGVIAMTALIFGAWVIVGFVRLIAHGIGMIFGPLPPMPSAHSVTCRAQLCGALNPSGARFCKRCGAQLPQVQHVSVRRAAMW